MTIQRISDSKTFQVWGTEYGADYDVTYFLIWDDFKWRWVDADDYRPYVDPPHPEGYYHVNH